MNVNSFLALWALANLSMPVEAHNHGLSPVKTDLTLGIAAGTTLGVAIVMYTIGRIIPGTPKGSPGPLMSITSVLWFIVRNDPSATVRSKWIIWGAWFIFTVTFVQLQYRKFALWNLYLLTTLIFTLICLCAVAALQESQLSGALVSTAPMCTSFAAYFMTFVFSDTERKTKGPGLHTLRLSSGLHDSICDPYARRKTDENSVKADIALKAVAKAIDIAMMFGKGPNIYLDLPPQLIDFLQEGLIHERELDLVVTTTGTLNQAYATTARAYLEFAWPSMELDVLELLNNARRGQGHAEMISSQLSASVDPVFIGNTPIWRVSVRGSGESVTALAQQICWLSACFRSPPALGISYSNVILKRDVLYPDCIKINLEDFQPESMKKSPIGSCWHQMFHNFVIATGFPIPTRDNEKGIELPFELMLSLGRVLYPVDCSQSIVLKGNSTALIPMSQTQNSIQWHFESQEDQKQPISLLTIRKLCEKALKGSSLESMCDTRKRHFLGLWEHAEIHLGTAHSNYRTITRSGTDVESSRPLIVRELAVTLGSSGFGAFGAQFQAKFAWPKVVQAELDTEEQLLIDQIRHAGDNASILYDTDTKCGWLVPELSLIYELILAWAIRQKEPHREMVLSRLPRADVDYGGAGRPISDLLHMEGNRVILPKSVNGQEVLLRDLFISILKALQQRKDQIALNNEEGFQFPLLLQSSILRGWDFDDIASRIPVAKRRKIPIPRSSGGWESIPAQNPNILVVLCAKAGFPIRARDRTRICDYWTPLPPPNGYLVASVPTVLALTQNLPGSSENPKLSAKSYYCSRRKGAKLFEPCRFGSADHECNRLLQLQNRPTLARSFQVISNAKAKRSK